MTREELETPRTAAEMLGWVYAAHARFRATKQLRAAAREGKFFAKELIQEALPIALFAHRYYNASPEVTISHVLGNQTYDALVADNRQSPAAATHIEATVSDWSYTEALRMEMLTRDGHAPGYGHVSAVGPRGNRTELRAELAAVRHEDLRAKHIAGVIAAVNRKAAITYPDGTALVVRVDDSVPFRNDDDVAELDHVARTILLPVVARREFRVLALEGSRAVHLAYDLGPPY